MKLEVKGIHAFHGLARVLSGINLTVPEGKMIGLIGPNGAGKSTTIFSICGLHQVTEGHIFIDSKEITHLSPQAIKKSGIATAPEGRRLFSKMTVLDNLLIGAHLIQDKKITNQAMSEVFSLFPILKDRKKQLAGSLSGGEQQMLTIGRAMMAVPRVMLVDEMSLGLAPIIIREIYRIIKSINEKGVSILVVEQQATIAFKFASYIYVMELGKIAMEGEPKELIRNDHVINTYLGEWDSKPVPVSISLS
jgi:branched-chain amino acid transport system ATP-binding protein